jgi:ATP-binding cassette subfamily B protein
MQRVIEILDSRSHESLGGLSDAFSFISGGPEMAPALPQSADNRSGAVVDPSAENRSGAAVDPPADSRPGAAVDPSPVDRSEPALLPNGPLEFKHLTFAYDDRGPALRDVSFVVPAGSVVAVVGPTGSGKSTLGTLLCRLYEPPRDTVWIGGRDVLDLPLGPLRRSVGYVPQESFLFSRPLRDNVRLADEHARPERLEEVARTAGLADDLGALPAGWDTVVGERGLTLSGGQRQRVALARALVADPPFLVLDDVLASVDAAKEWEITRALRAAASGRTTLIMTHRLKAAAEADRIVVLDEGRVVEEGRHAELVAAGGLYARLWRVQQLEDELANA